MKKGDLLNRIDQLIKKGQSVHQTKRSSEFGINYVNRWFQIGFRTASLSFIKNLYDENHPFFRDFNERVKGQAYQETENGINILTSIRNEVENDWLVSLKQLVSSEIFAYFLEMSKHLLDLNYKDPAAVMIGSTLEEHLRLLCQNHSVEIEIKKSGVLIPKKANLLNADLV